MVNLHMLRYLGSVAGASALGIPASLPPAQCRDQHRNIGMEKLRMQQHREAPRGPDVGPLLTCPPPALGLGACTRWTARNLWTSLQVRLRILKLDSNETDNALPRRKRVVVAGGGWASASFVHRLDPRQFEVVWISPQDHFSYTPLLPAVCGGSLPVAACTAKLRDLLCFGGSPGARGRYHRAYVEGVNLANKTVTCRPAESPGGPPSSSRGPPSMTWEEPYDYLVLAVGSDVNTFNIKGVEEHAMYLKSAEDAQRVRARLGACLEAAARPSTPQEIRERLLTFVIVGAGPSGIEAAAEIRDYLNKDGGRLYPQLRHLFRVIVVEMGSAPLPMYNAKVQQGVYNTFARSGVELRLNTQVVQISADAVLVKSLKPAPAASAASSSASPSSASSASSSEPEGPSGSVESIGTEFVLWASGVRPTELTMSIAKSLSSQRGPPRLVVDPSLRVVGSEDLFALGDCCSISPPLLADYADTLFDLACKSERREGRETGGDRDDPADSGRRAGTDWLIENSKRLSSIFPQLHPKRSGLEAVPSKDNLDINQFKQLLQEIDSRYSSPAPTAQNARQEGNFLALLFNTYLGAPKEGPPGSRTSGGAVGSMELPGFVERWRGSLCYLGDGVAALQLPVGTVVGGFYSTLLWRLVYLQLQLSSRSFWRCLEGWIQSAVFGRDIACVIPPTPKAASSASNL